MLFSDNIIFNKLFKTQHVTDSATGQRTSLSSVAEGDLGGCAAGALVIVRLHVHLNRLVVQPRPHTTIVLHPVKYGRRVLLAPDRVRHLVVEILPIVLNLRHTLQTSRNTLK